MRRVVVNLEYVTPFNQATLDKKLLRRIGAFCEGCYNVYTHFVNMEAVSTENWAQRSLLQGTTQSLPLTEYNGSFIVAFNFTGTLEQVIYKRELAAALFYTVDANVEDNVFAKGWEDVIQQALNESGRVLAREINSGWAPNSELNAFTNLKGFSAALASHIQGNTTANASDVVQHFQPTYDWKKVHNHWVQLQKSSATSHTRVAFRYQMLAALFCIAALVQVV